MDKNSITLGARFFFHNGFRWFKNINKLSIYNKYLLNNLPKVVTHPNDLYIYMVIQRAILSKKIVKKNYIYLIELNLFIVIKFLK